MYSLKAAALLSIGAAASSDMESFATDSLAANSLPTFNPMAVPDKIGNLLANVGMDASHAENNLFGSTQLRMSPQTQGKLRWARQAAGIHDDHFAWNEPSVPVVPKPTSEQISARQAAAVVKKAAATPEPVVNTTTTEEVPEKTIIPEVEVHPFANPMTYLPCIVFLFIVVAGIFFTVLGAFWERAYSDKKKLTLQKGKSKEEFQALLKNQSSRRAV